MKEKLKLILDRITELNSILDNHHLELLDKYSNDLKEGFSAEQGKKELAELEKTIKNLHDSFHTLEKRSRTELKTNPDIHELIISLLRATQDIADFKDAVKQNNPSEDKGKKAQIAIWTLGKNWKNIKNEFIKGIKNNLSEIDRELLFLLSKRTIQEWKTFEKYYVGENKPFIDKFAREYRLHGFPNALLEGVLESKDKYDVFVCVLRGALPIILFFKLLGVSDDKILYCGISRPESKITKEKILHVVPDWSKVRSKRVLIVDNSVTYGGTIKKIIQLIKDHEPSKVGLFTLRVDKFSQHQFEKGMEAVQNNFSSDNLHITNEMQIKDLERIEDIKLLLIRRLSWFSFFKLKIKPKRLIKLQE